MLDSKYKSWILLLCTIIFVLLLCNKYHRQFIRKIKNGEIILPTFSYYWRFILVDIKVPSRICWTNLQCCSPVCQYTESTSTASVHCSVPKPHMIPNFRMSRDAFHIIIKCMLTWAPTRSHPSAFSWMMSQLQLIYKTLTTLTYKYTHTNDSDNYSAHAHEERYKSSTEGWPSTIS